MSGMMGVWYMQPGHLDSPPSDSYFDMVLRGYREHGVSTEQLFNAVERYPELTEYL